MDKAGDKAAEAKKAGNDDFEKGAWLQQRANEVNDLLYYGVLYPLPRVCTSEMFAEAKSLSAKEAAQMIFKKAIPELSRQDIGRKKPLSRVKGFSSS